MGKKNKHSKDKLHKTVSELTSHHVGTSRDLELSVLHRRLKFDSCCLTLDSVSVKPMGLCDEDNFCYVFECDAILKFLEKYQVHPITGKKVTANNLIELKFHRNSDNEYHCPIIYKLFNQHSRIVANKKTGNVYSHDAYVQLNLKANFFKDLLTDEPFDQGDIVTIQDPSKAEEKWNVTSFYYTKEKLRLEDESEGSNRIRKIEQSSILKASLDEYNKNADKIAAEFNKLVGQESSTGSEVKLDKLNSAHHSDGSLARSVTSTVMPVACSQNPAILDEEQILYPRIKKKGYVQLMTNFGPLNLELYCDRTPKTCHNFLLLASRGYYNDTIFHRLIKNFILQGGDPTGTGSGGQSAWGAPFKDECHGDLKHAGRGVLAMANSGPATNKSQFYIILRGTWDHLDGKHTVFGRVVGGDATLDRIESIEVDKKERPKEAVKILQVTIYVNPFEDAQKAINEERRLEAQASLTGKSKTKRKAEEGATLKKFRQGVGSYIDLDRLRKSSASAENAQLDSKREPLTNDDSKSDADSLKGPSLSDKLAAIASNKLSSSTTKFRSAADFSNW